MIPHHLTEPWSEAHPDRERIRKAAVDGYNNQDTSVLTEAFSGLPDNEKHNAWFYLTLSDMMTFVEFSKYVHKACAEALLALHGIPTGDAGIGVMPRIELGFVRAAFWGLPGDKR